jgi:hypothetical protein
VATWFGKGGRLPIMFSGLKSFLRRRKQTIAIASSVIVLLVGFLYFYEPSSPEGIYYDPDLACGYGVWIFKDGKVFVQCDGETPRESGLYVKSGNRWTSVEKNGAVFKPSILGIKVYDPFLHNGQSFWFRSKFSWIVDCKEWFQKHF